MLQMFIRDTVTLEFLGLIVELICHLETNFQSIVTAFSNIRMNKGGSSSETVRRAPGR